MPVFSDPSPFINAPHHESIDVLEKRLIARSTDTPEVIATRVEKAAFELTFAQKFDKIIINDKLEDAFFEAEETLRKFLGS